MKTARGFFNEERRVEVLNSNPDVLQMPEDLALFQLVKFLLQFNQLVTGILQNTAFALWRLHGSHIDRGLDRTSYAIVTNNGRIKNFVVSLEHFVELIADGVG